MNVRCLGSYFMCLVLALAVVTQGSRAIAQTEDMKVVQGALKLAREGKLLAAIKTMEDDSIAPDLASHISTLLYSFVGDWGKVHDLKNSNQKNNVVTAPSDATFVPAISAIVDAVRGHRIVIELSS
jgi:hypothetical protein